MYIYIYIHFTYEYTYISKTFILQGFAVTLRLIKPLVAVGRPQKSLFARGAEDASQFGSNGLVLPVYVQGPLGRHFFLEKDSRMLIDVKFFTYIFDVCIYIYTHFMLMVRSRFITVMSFLPSVNTIYTILAS